MTGLFWLLLANAGVLLGARRLATRFATGHAATDAALFLLFRLMLISAASSRRAPFTSSTPGSSAWREASPPAR